MTPEPKELEARVQAFHDNFVAIREEINKEVVGYSDIIEKVLVCLFANGHVLLEGVPGLGKTLLVRTLARTLHLDFSRIQFTPDIMPADIVGTQIMVLGEDGAKEFRFQQGPVFANILLADEINRATPKTQSALLEAMQEHSVTIGGTTHRLDEPFFVLGTQNPIEMEGTYPLPEAQLDRFFFKLMVTYLGEEDLLSIIDRTTSTAEAVLQATIGPEDIAWMRSLVREVAVAEHVKRYAVRLVLATHPDSEVATPEVRRYVKFGASPRGIQTMILGGKVQALIDGRYHLSCEDLKEVIKPALRHRIILNFEGEAEDKTTDEILDSVLSAVPELKAATSVA
ncbi:MAG: AAA family ATPase [Planctomycetota bacterium]|nr:MAG: AAA family ATPase [Planctomycetota bacterium]